MNNNTSERHTFQPWPFEDDADTDYCFQLRRDATTTLDFCGLPRDAEIHQPYEHLCSLCASTERSYEKPPNDPSIAYLCGGCAKNLRANDRRVPQDVHDWWFNAGEIETE